jgi:hypothetical protein
MPWTKAEITEFERRVNLANSHFARFKSSSLASLITLIKTTPLPTADAVRKAIAAIPANKRDVKYVSAINYIRKNFPALDEVKSGGFTYKNFAGVQDEKARLVRAQRAPDLCYQLVLNCRKALGKVVANTATSSSPGSWSKDQQKATELFQRWFDASRQHSSVERVRQVFTAMENSLRSVDWEIILYGTPEDPDPEGYGGAIPNAFAFVIPSENAYRIYLGALFWKEGASDIDAPTVTHGSLSAPSEEQWREQKKTKSAMDAAIVTTLHELCHVRAISGATAITDVAPDPYGIPKCKQRAKTEPHLALTNAENYAQFASALLMEQHFF